MLRLTSKITIGDFLFNNCVEVKIRSSWNELTDTATVTIPRKVKWTELDLVAGDQPALKVGDYVKIELGYNFNYTTYFEGLVTNISAKTPVTIECQDVMWLMKQVQHKKTYPKGTKLSTVLTDLQTTYNASDIKKKYKREVKFIPYGEITAQTTVVSSDKKRTEEAEIGELRCDNVTIAFVLETFKSKLSLPTFVRDGNILTGLAYYPEQQNIIERMFDYHVISDSMEYKRSEDNKIKLVVKVPDSKTLAPVEVGDSDGATRTLLAPGLTTQAQMKEAGEREIEKYKYTGWFGSFTTFGDEYIKHGDAIKLSDKVITDRNGTYSVKTVETTFGTGGFRNEIELDRKLL